ncbi:MAG: phage portal protein [Chloroflexi bacterium]|nr:phage portal protein [Chloroflexota bacterium]
MEKIADNSQLIEKTAHIRGLESEYVPHAGGLGITKQIFTKEKGISIETLYKTIRASPEITACIVATIEDIMADSWRFVGSDSAKNKARKFQLTSNLYKVLTNAIFDLIGTGDAYILKLSVDEKAVKSLISKLTEKIAKSMELFNSKFKFNKNTVYELLEQDVKIPKDLQLLKASTVSINFDETGKLLSYEQKVGGKVVRVYQPKDIIHLSLFNIGGQPYGFTPLETALSDVATLIFAKEFAGKYFENDGIPYFIFHMPDATPDDRNYTNLVKELKELKKEANKYRSMVVTGNVTSEQVNKFNKDMEFAKLISHFTQVILMTMGVPAHRVNLTIDVRQIGGAVNRAYEGYYKKLSFMQQIIENSLNSELWNSWNVELRFNKVYKIDEMREAQVIQILTTAGLVTVEEAREMMGLEPEKPKGTEPRGQSPIGMDTSINQRAGESDPKKPKNTQDNQTKIAKSFEESLEVNYPDFIRIVEHKMGTGNFDNANVLYIETIDQFVLFFSDGNWKYKTKVDKKTLVDIEKFRFEKLRNAVKLFT